MEQIHILPVNDLIEHAMNLRCICGPRSEYCEHEDGEKLILVLHNSFDFREYEEEEEDEDDFGRLTQLVECFRYMEEVGGSSPSMPTL